MKKKATSKKQEKQLHRPKTVYDLQAEICGALASHVRLQIIELLSEKERTSAEILEVLKIPKANLSQHLSVLKDAGILSSRKEGLFQYLTIAIPRIKDACSLVRSVLLERIAYEEKLNLEIVKNLNLKDKK